MYCKNKLVFISLVFLAAILLLESSCRKESKIPYEPYQPAAVPDNPTDKAIAEIYNTYQSKIIYKWNDRYFSADARATPPKFDLILPYIDSVLEDLFIHAYDSQQEGFMLKHMPVEMVLVGSDISYTNGEEENFNASGLTQGFSRIVVSGINQYDMKDSSWLRREYATLHHEFAHVLANRYGRPVGFDEVSKGLYAGSTSFAHFSQDEAHERGFWRNYGMSNESEDFATWVEGIVTTPKEEVLEFVNENDLLKQKYMLVYNFYLSLGIDLHTLNTYLEQKLH